MNEKFTEQELKEAWERNAKALKYKNGTVWNSNSFGTYTIIGKFDKRNYYIKFSNTGTICIRRSDVFDSGQVKDYYAPSVCNVGYFGEGGYSKKLHRHLYERWVGMLKRCYGNKDENNSYKDCTVAQDWLNFQNYARDVEALMNEKGLENLDGYHIDKDIKIKGNRIYSKDTVSLVPQLENIYEMLDRIHDTIYIAENLKTGKKIEFTNKTKFARENNIDRRAITSTILGERKSVKDWTFYKKGDKAQHIDIVIYIAENVKTREKIEFTDKKSFEKEYNLYRDAITRVLRGERKTAGGYRFYRKED